MKAALICKSVDLCTVLPATYLHVLCFLMRSRETELEMVRRHVREGERQLALIARLDARGLPTEEAANLLAVFEEVQGMHEAHLTLMKGHEN